METCTDALCQDAADMYAAATHNTVSRLGSVLVLVSYPFLTQPVTMSAWKQNCRLISVCTDDMT